MLLQGKGAMFFHMKMEHIGQYKNMAQQYAGVRERGDVEGQSRVKLDNWERGSSLRLPAQVLTHG